jgi:hypothetical protein
MSSLRLSTRNGFSGYLAVGTVLAAALTGYSLLGQPGGDGVRVDPKLLSTPISSDVFLKAQSASQWRVATLVGMSVFDSDGNPAGRIKDVLIGRDGAAQDVVIAVGGFLGLDAKVVALPFRAITWGTHSRRASTKCMRLSLPPDGAPAAPAVQPSNSSATEAKPCYPDKAYVALSRTQLQTAPDFKYSQGPSGFPDVSAISREAPYE